MLLERFKNLLFVSFLAYTYFLSERLKWFDQHLQSNQFELLVKRPGADFTNITFLRLSLNQSQT